MREGRCLCGFPKFCLVHCSSQLFAQGLEGRSCSLGSARGCCQWNPRWKRCNLSGPVKAGMSGLCWVRVSPEAHGTPECLLAALLMSRKCYLLLESVPEVPSSPLVSGSAVPDQCSRSQPALQALCEYIYLTPREQSPPSAVFLFIPWTQTPNLLFFHPLLCEGEKSLVAVL